MYTWCILMQKRLGVRGQYTTNGALWKSGIAREVETEVWGHCHCEGGMFRDDETLSTRQGLALRGECLRGRLVETRRQEYEGTANVATPSYYDAF